MQLSGWDLALKVTADGTGLVGHAGAILLRKAADQAGLTAELSAALQKKGTSPVFDRGTVLASLVAATALGATSRAPRLRTLARRPGDHHQGSGLLGRR